MEEVSNNMNFPELSQEEKAGKLQWTHPCCHVLWEHAWQDTPQSMSAFPSWWPKCIRNTYSQGVYNLLKKQGKLFSSFSALAIQCLSRIASWPLTCKSFKHQTCSSDGQSNACKTVALGKEVAGFIRDGGLQKALLPSDLAVPESNTKHLQWLPPSP